MTKTEDKTYDKGFEDGRRYETLVRIIGDKAHLLAGMLTRAKDGGRVEITSRDLYSERTRMEEMHEQARAIEEMAEIKDSDADRVFADYLTLNNLALNKELGIVLKLRGDRK